MKDRNTKRMAEDKTFDSCYQQRGMKIESKAWEKLTKKQQMTA